MLRTLSQLGASALVLVLIGILVPDRAESVMHLHLTRSMPAQDTLLATPPGELRLWFSEAPRIKLTRLTLTGPAGPVKLGSVQQDSLDEKSVVSAIEGKLVDGDYTVAWRTAASDGHLAKGTIGFGVRPE